MKYLFYTAEGSTQSPDNRLVENFQILGDACGVDCKEALGNLLADNLWIKEMGYDTNNILYHKIAD